MRIKVVINVREVGMPVHVKIGVSQTSDIMVQSKVHVDDQAVVISDNSVVDRVNIFPFIEPSRVVGVFVWPRDLDTGLRSYLSCDPISCNIA